MNSFKESFWPILIISFLVAFLGIAILGWQYQRISQKEIDSLKQNIEQNLAKELVNKFMEYRIENKEEQAMIYLTENAMEQKNRGDFLLIDNIKSFKIEKIDKLTETDYRFTVKIQKENKINDLTEIIIVNKNLDLNEYYIDSVIIGG